jgi:hypothetical protein
MDMVIAVYQGVIEKYKCKAAWQKELVVSQLRLAAVRMLKSMDSAKRALWGFKLPENLLLLPELNQAFPCARYIQMFRNPVNCPGHTCARLDGANRVTCHLTRKLAGFSETHLLCAATTLHQLNVHFIRKPT